MSRLAIFREDTFEEEHVLMRATVGLGRHPDNDIVLNDRTLSRFHARLERRGGEYVVIDLGAQNGVYLNGQKITGEHALTAGDRIGLGCYVAIFDHQGNASSRRRSDPTPPKSSAPVALPTNALTPLLDEPSSQGTSELVDLDLGVDLDIDFSSDVETFDRNATHVEEKSAKEETQPTLVLMYNGEEVSRHLVTAEPLVIGRSKTCDIVISLLGLSRRHTRVHLAGDQIHVTDLGSQNGTWINNHRIDGERSLRHGDLLNYYEYGVLFLKDPSVDIGPPGVEFDVDDRTGALDAVETHQRSLENVPQVAKVNRDQARTSMSPVPIVDSDVHTPGANPSDDDKEEDFDLFDGFDLDDNKSYLNEVEDEKEEEPGLLDLLDDDDDDDFKPTATEVLQKKLDQGGSVLEKTQGNPNPHDPALSDLELDDLGLGDSDSFATGDPTRAQNSLSFESATANIEKTSAVVVPSNLGRSVWPSEIEFGDALSKDNDRFSWQLAVFLDGKPYTQMVVSQQAVRVGTDARCELALPKKAGLTGWQLTFVDFGQNLLCIRASADARVVVDDVPIDQAVLQAKDVVVMGRVRIEVLRR